MNIRIFAILLAAGAASLLAGCGGESSGGSSTAAAPQAAKAAPLPAPSREIVIVANDQMKFDLTAITVAPGETVKLTLKNEGTMPKFSMGHNIVILKRGTGVDGFAAEAASAPATDYIPAAQAGKVIAHTKMLGGGESDSVVFTAPKIRADYPFLCTFPGHLQAGMRGVLKVQ